MAYVFEVDSGKHLLHFHIIGSVVSYIATATNIFVVAILCRKRLKSPATILMQGLALSDGLTAFFSYGLESILHENYECRFIKSDGIFHCKLLYPYCSIVAQMSLMSMTFHNISILLTTFLGLQKVIAIMFPIWI